MIWAARTQRRHAENRRNFAGPKPQRRALLGGDQGVHHVQLRLRLVGNGVEHLEVGSGKGAARASAHVVPDGCDIEGVSIPGRPWRTDLARQDGLVVVRAGLTQGVTGFVPFDGSVGPPATTSELYRTRRSDERDLIGAWPFLVDVLSVVPAGRCTTHRARDGKATISMADQSNEVTGGVDTHADNHVAAHRRGGPGVGHPVIPATTVGYKALLAWLGGHSRGVRVGVEGTCSYGAGLAHYLADQDVAVVEVNRPNRQQRRRRGKSDPTDAEAAARAALNGEASAAPKAGGGPVEAIRVLALTRRSALKARTQANQVRDLIVTALTSSDPLSADLDTDDRVDACARFCPVAGADHQPQVPLRGRVRRNPPERRGVGGFGSCQLVVQHAVGQEQPPAYSASYPVDKTEYLVAKTDNTRSSSDATHVRNGPKLACSGPWNRGPSAARTRPAVIYSIHSIR